MARRNQTKASVANLSEPIIIPPDQAADESSVAYQIMDSADQMQMIEASEGNFSEIGEALVYQFMQDGKQVTGLSWVGTKESALLLAKKGDLKISITELTYTQDPTDPEYMIFQAKATDEITGRSTICVKRQWTKLKKRDGSVVTNQFWLEHGSSKVKRNASQELMPVSFIKQMIKQWIKKGKYLTLTAPKQGNGGQAPTNPMLLNKIRPVLSAIEAFKTKKELLEYEQKVLVKNEKERKYTGQEMYAIRQAFAAKVAHLKI